MLKKQDDVLTILCPVVVESPAYHTLEKREIKKIITAQYIVTNVLIGYCTLLNR